MASSILPTSHLKEIEVAELLKANIGYSNKLVYLIEKHSYLNRYQTISKIIFIQIIIPYVRMYIDHTEKFKGVTLIIVVTNFY